MNGEHVKKQTKNNKGFDNKQKDTLSLRLGAIYNKVRNDREIYPKDTYRKHRHQKTGDSRFGKVGSKGTPKFLKGAAPVPPYRFGNGVVHSGGGRTDADHCHTKHDPEKAKDH